jgi:hypothetical protein
MIILDDTVVMVKCLACEEMIPEDEAVEFEGNYFCNGDAEWCGVARCAWCGKGGDIMKMIIYDGDECHEKCMDEMVERKNVEPERNLIMERAKLESQREDAGEERREIARDNMEELLRGYKEKKS